MISTASTVDETNVHAGKGEHARHHFDVKHVLHEMKHYLPSQTPIKDFIHHNSLHAFQQMKFFDAIFKASKIFGFQATLPLHEFRQLYQVGRIKNVVLERVIAERKGTQLLAEWKENLVIKEYDDITKPRIGLLRNNWKSEHRIDLDALVHPLLYRVICSYLDQGIATWQFPVTNLGFLEAIRSLEKNSYTSFFKTKRAKSLLLEGNCTIPGLLKIVVGNEDYYEQYLYDQQFSHKGWSGMVSVVEDFPATLYDQRKVSLNDFIIFELLLEIDALDKALGKWRPLAEAKKSRPVDLFADVQTTELHEVLTLWQHAFEWSYYDEVLAGLASGKQTSQPVTAKTSFQAMFCIDERECSFRRYVEQCAPDAETFGTPGFFGVEFYFQPENGKFYDKLCPAPVTPKYLIKESGVKGEKKHELLYTSKTHTLLPGFLLSFLFGALSAGRLFLNVFRPKMSPAISNAFGHMDRQSTLTIENKDIADRENDLQIGFTIAEMAARVEGVLRSISLIKDFAAVVYVIAHGSSSANNPHHGAHDCGACSGRPGSVNARVFAHMANHSGVRVLLKEKGIDIPADTQFVGALHDTAGDEIEFYDEHVLNAQNRRDHELHLVVFEKALDLNAKERSRRFASIDTKGNLKQVRKAIKDRSVSLFEPRPELGHGTNALCIVGGRQMTKNIFLDRRAFMNSYNYKTDPEGTILSRIMAPLGPVCGGINLEYYFSRVDNHKLGAGTKLPHNLMGLLGVANGADGDLLPGLPLQMIEVHDPVRLLLIVEHFPDVVLKTVQAVPAMYEWYINEWVHLLAIDPQTRKFHYFKEGVFIEYEPLLKAVGTVNNMVELVESAKIMQTNQTVDATLENLPVQVLN